MERKSPFPGMDPYLERNWSEVHATLIVYARNQINPQLPDDLRANIETNLAVLKNSEFDRSMGPDLHVAEEKRDDCYRDGRYYRLDYRRDPVPNFTDDDNHWADSLLRQCDAR